MTAEDVGGYGHRESGSIWFKYRAFREEGGNKIPVGKLCKWNKDTKAEEEFSYVSGLMQSVQFRLNEGNPSKGVEEFNEIVIALSAVQDGVAAVFKVALRASSTAAFSVVRRLAAVTRGELVAVKAYLIAEAGQKRPGLTLMRVVGGQELRIEPVETDVPFREYGGLKGPRLDVAKNENAMLREEWVETTVRGLAFFDDGAAHLAAAVTEKPVGGGEYDPFALE